MVRRYPLTFAACILITLSISPVAPATAAPDPVTTSLAGTWRVSRTCLAGCAGSTTVTEVVRPYAPHVFMAHGGLTLELYQIGNQVLVHGAASSSLLTIRIPGRLMSGSSVGAGGSTFTTSWRCVAAPTSTTSTSGARTAGITREGPQVVSGARVHC
jgi:hypothetical protein